MSFIFLVLRFPTIYFSTVSPTPLTVVAQPQSPRLQSPTGLGNLESPINDFTERLKYLILRGLAIEISKRNE